MKFQAFISLWIASFLITLPLSTVDAQILNSLKRKLEDKIEKMGEEEIDKEISKKVDSELEQDTSLRKDTTYGGYDRTNQALMEGILGSKYNVEDVELPETYDFQLTVTYEVSSGKKKDVTHMKYLFPEDGLKVIGFETMDEDQKAVNQIVWDLEREVMVMYSEDKKGNKTLQKLPSFTKLMSKQIEKETASQEPMEIRKTGNSKVILGYSCDEYIMENDEVITHAWIAEGFEYDYGDFADVLVQQMKSSGVNKMKDVRGFPLEMKTKPEGKKDFQTHSKAIDIDRNGLRIDNSSYQQK